MVNYLFKRWVLVSIPRNWRNDRSKMAGKDELGVSDRVLTATTILVVQFKIGSPWKIEVRSGVSHSEKWCTVLIVNVREVFVRDPISLVGQFWTTKASWLVVWLPFLAFSRILGMSSSQLTFIFFRGVAQPPTSQHVNFARIISTKSGDRPQIPPKISRCSCRKKKATEIASYPRFETETVLHSAFFWITPLMCR